MNSQFDNEILLENKIMSRRNKILLVLACIVVFFVTYALILPAITMERNTVTQSTAQTDKVLVCKLQEHRHSEECNDENGNLICNTKVHIHSDKCYKEPTKNDTKFVLPPAHVYSSSDVTETTQTAKQQQTTEEKTTESEAN